MMFTNLLSDKNIAHTRQNIQHTNETSTIAARERPERNDQKRLQKSDDDTGSLEELIKLQSDIRVDVI